MSDRVLLDTHALVWLSAGMTQLGPDSRKLANTALTEGSLLVSAISFWEIALLASKGHIEIDHPVATLRNILLENGSVEAQISGDIGILAVELEGLPGDPADRLIIATAIMRDATLLTADERILGWSGDVRRQDARL